MTFSSSELLININRKAPWIMEGEKTFFPESIHGDTQQLLDGIKDYNLTIITNKGRVFKQYVILKLEEGKVLIDTPFEWDCSVTSFHVFFRNKNNIWNFFEASEAESNETTITIGIPEKIFLLQKRRFKRALTPIGTKVLFKNDSNLIDTAFVHDISEGGMQIWSGESKAGYQVDSILNEIFISLPANGNIGEAENFQRVLPYITKGKIVRTQVDEESLITHYGVSFIHENKILYKRFNTMIADLKKQYSTGNKPEQGLDFTTGRQQMLSPTGTDG